MRSQAILWAVAISTSACTVLPSVEYRALSKDDESQAVGIADSFYRNASVVEISLTSTGPVKNEKGDSVPAGELTIASKPREYRVQKLGVVPITDWRSSTTVNITKILNTDRVSSIGVEVVDDTTKRITEAGGVVVKLIGLFLADAPEPPCVKAGGVIELDVWNQTTETRTYQGTSGTQCITVKMHEPPVDAITEAQLPLRTRTHNFYYSACRDATITVTQAPSQVITKTVRIADPRRLQFVRFPAKGSITLHSECGVSVQTDKVAADNSFAIVDALAAQGKAIKDALEASKK
jgi:hypothetical protein